MCELHFNKTKLESILSVSLALCGRKIKPLLLNTLSTGAKKIGKYKNKHKCHKI